MFKVASITLCMRCNTPHMMVSRDIWQHMYTHTALEAEPCMHGVTMHGVTIIITQ